MTGGVAGDPWQPIRDFVRKERTGRGMSYAAAAIHCGVSASTVERAEKGPKVKPDQLLAILAGFERGVQRAKADFAAVDYVFSEAMYRAKRPEPVKALAADLAAIIQSAKKAQAVLGRLEDQMRAT